MFTLRYDLFRPRPERVYLVFETLPPDEEVAVIAVEKSLAAARRRIQEAYDGYAALHAENPNAAPPSAYRFSHAMWIVGGDMIANYTVSPLSIPTERPVAGPILSLSNPE